MTQPARAVFFDVDGVLLDSLPQHLRICADQAAALGLGLTIPDVAGFRRQVAAGLTISPMKAFFRAVGFPEPQAEQAVAVYERDFMQQYRPSPFVGIAEMLQALHAAGLKLGLVTSNTRANIDPALGASLRCFEADACFYFDRRTAPQPKAWWLAEGAARLGLPASACLYVGDQPGDAAAAAQAGFGFLGVTYGWGIVPGDPRYDTVDSVPALAARLQPVPSAVSG